MRESAYLYGVKLTRRSIGNIEILGHFLLFLRQRNADIGKRGLINWSVKMSERDRSGEKRRHYTLEEQEKFNQKCAETINHYWAQYGYRANARVEDVLVYIDDAGNGKGRRLKSKEIVSAVTDFPFFKQQMGIE